MARASALSQCGRTGFLPDSVIRTPLVSKPKKANACIQVMFRALPAPSMAAQNVPALKLNQVFIADVTSHMAIALFAGSKFITRCLS